MGFLQAAASQLVYDAIGFALKGQLDSVSGWTQLLPQGEAVGRSSSSCLQHLRGVGPIGGGPESLIADARSAPGTVQRLAYLPAGPARRGLADHAGTDRRDRPGHPRQPAAAGLASAGQALLERNAERAKRWESTPTNSSTARAAPPAVQDDEAAFFRDLSWSDDDIADDLEDARST